VAAASSGGGIKFCEIATGECGKIEVLGNGQPYVFPIAYSPDGKWVVSGSGRGVIALWDTGTGKVAGRVQGPSIAVEAIAVSPDGRWLASGGDDDNAKLWRALP
jgi:WD40 repeat protein